ncbi:MAG: nucleotidyl transferase AbiEii/AbiGii toxin family protein [Steroidobacteraceae bacterium]
MTTLSVRSDRPLDPITVEVLCAVDSAARDLAIDYFVAGAMARDIVLLNVRGFDTLRATRDIDLAVSVSGWDQFDALKTRLIDSHGFSTGNGATQRVYYAAVYPVDLVPFGGVVEDDGNISWPPDSAIVMNVLGYNEALYSTLKVEVRPGTVIPVASLASLAMLKVFAWTDRGHRDRKDALDLALLLRRYADTIDAGDLHSSEVAVLEAVDYDYERAGARILGKHVRQMAAPQTAGELLSHLQREPTRNRLAIDMAQALRNSEDPVELADQLLGDFIAGLSTP